MDVWHDSLYNTRQFMRGWHRQQVGEQNKTKLDMLAQLEVLDGKADYEGLSLAEWENRYKLEESLEKILSMRRSFGNKNMRRPW